MKKYVVIKTCFEGYHRYLDAPQEVSFLRNMHRHLFYVTAKIQVYNNDRELEFFMVKNLLNRLIDIMNESLTSNKSCESMAEFLICELQKVYGDTRYYCVEVSEDNENSAIAETV